MILTEEQFDEMGPSEEMLAFTDIDGGTSLTAELLQRTIITAHEFNIINFAQPHFGLTEDRADKVLHHVWTIVSGDYGMFAAPGFHRVNREGLIVTEKPWTDDVEEAVYWEYDEDDDIDEGLDDTKPLVPPAKPK